MSRSPQGRKFFRSQVRRTFSDVGRQAMRWIWSAARMQKPHARPASKRRLVRCFQFRGRFVGGPIARSTRCAAIEPSRCQASRSVSIAAACFLGRPKNGCEDIGNGHVAGPAVAGYASLVLRQLDSFSAAGAHKPGGFFSRGSARGVVGPHPIEDFPQVEANHPGRELQVGHSVPRPVVDGAWADSDGFRKGDAVV